MGADTGVQATRPTIVGGRAAKPHGAMTTTQVVDVEQPTLGGGDWLKVP